MLEGERLACDGRQCFTHFYYIIGLGPSILLNDSSARARECLSLEGGEIVYPPTSGGVNFRTTGLALIG